MFCESSIERKTIWLIRSSCSWTWMAINSLVSQTPLTVSYFPWVFLWLDSPSFSLFVKIAVTPSGFRLNELCGDMGTWKVNVLSYLREKTNSGTLGAKIVNVDSFRTHCNSVSVTIDVVLSVTINVILSATS